MKTYTEKNVKAGISKEFRKQYISKDTHPKAFGPARVSESKPSLDFLYYRSETNGKFILNAGKYYSPTSILTFMKKVQKNIDYLHDSQYLKKFEDWKERFREAPPADGRTFCLLTEEPLEVWLSFLNWLKRRVTE